MWGVWLGALLRGRVPLLGPPVGALERDDGGRPVLVLDAPPPWRQEVEFDPAGGQPVRMLLWQGGEPRVEVLLDRFLEVEGQPFPGRVEVRTEEPRGGYEIEFRRVAVDEGEDVGVFRLTPPPGTRVLDVRGSAQWSETELPLWLPIPDG